MASTDLSLGLHRIAPERGETYCLAARGLSGVTLDLSGVTLLVSDPMAGGVLLDNCEDVELRGLVIDYDPLPYTECVIQTIEDDTFTVSVGAGFVALDDPRFQYGSLDTHPFQYGVVMDGGGRPKPGVRDHLFVERCERLSTETFRLTPVPGYTLAGFERGDQFVYVMRGPGHAVSVQRGRGVRISDVEVRAANHHAFSAGAESSDVAFDGCRVTRVAGRAATSCGDGIHVRNCRSGTSVERCELEGMLDDGFNVCADPLGRGGRAREGDRVQVIDLEHGIDLGERVIESVSPLRFDRAVPPDAFAVNLDASGCGYVVRDTVFRDHRGLGMRLRAGRGLVERNRIERVGDTAIAIGNDPNWPEGPASFDVTVRENHIEGCGYSTGRAPAIVVAGLARGGRPPRDPLVRDIRVTNNVIRGGSTYVVGARDCVIEDNDAS